MSVPGALLTVPLLLLQGGFPGAASDSVALKEGENLNLNCTFSSPSSSNFTLQWLNPRNFTIFLNAQQVLRDQRYKLLRYAKDELSIQLSNLTQQDEGIYRCLHYTRHVKTKSQNVEILAAPSPPELEISQDEGGGVQLCCLSQGGRPQPHISWLLDGGLELPGDTRHQLGADGKSWSSRSTLRILSYSPTVTASCIIQHPALGPRSLVASFPFQDLPSSGCKRASRPSEDAEVPSPSENPAVASSSENPADPEVSSPSASPENPELSSPSATPNDPGVSSLSASPKDPEDSSPSSSPENPEICNPSASPKDLEDSSPSASPGNPELSSTSAFPENPEVSSPSASPGNPEVSSPSASPGNPAAPSSAPAQPNLTDVTLHEQNPESKGLLRRERNLLLPMLVAALVLVLLIIVLLFMVKLRKAHGVWKRENDVSEQTLESYKSRSNEDSPGHEKNGQAGNPKSNMQYVTEGHLETPEKNLETPEKTLEAPEETLEAPEETLEAPEETLEAPEKALEAPEETLEVPEETLEVPEKALEVPERNLEAPEKALEAPEGSPGAKSGAVKEEMFWCGRETDV
ncbi:cytotoxic and regulatory T-cell molecule isoform X2 [Haemorhous mexicanus]|uniref:cytotoxic and regulatory T-cell molecule isoform X2 n=1 Tax=Haemorhous mexicanus TaxID=30427 RepID=UPI0028BF5069|nr:cytotoxic and regulatory T-cell molecule isoform X2 [Haemorhous mexicanus]